MFQWANNNILLPFYSKLSKKTVSQQLKDEVDMNQNILTTLYGVLPGSSLFLLNGLVLSPTTDIYALLDLLRSESYLLNQLHGLGLSVSLCCRRYY